MRRSLPSGVLSGSIVGVTIAIAMLAACDTEQPDFVPGFAPDGDDVATAATSSRAAVSSTAVSSGAGGEASTGGVRVSVDEPAPAVDLASSVVVTVTVAPEGQSGDVTLAASDVSAMGIAAVLADTSLVLDGTSPVTTSLTLTTATDAVPGDAAIAVTATTPSGERSASLMLTVRSAITITIPAGVAALGGTVEMPVTTAFGPYPTTIRAPAGISAQNPVTVRFFNADDAAHEIHADQPAQGFGHGMMSIAPSSLDGVVREINAAGQYDYYLHDQQVPIVVGRIVVQ